IKSDGSYTYTANDLNTDANKVDTFHYTIIDNDGDKATADLKITVDGEKPDVPGPDGKNDFCTIILPAESFKSNLLANDSFAAGGGFLKSVKVGNVVTQIAVNGITTVAVAHGVIKFQSNGQYTFELNDASSAPTSSQNIQITIADANGKTDTTTLQINIVGADLQGTDGQDTINATNANDVVNGNDGDDWIYGYGGDDTLSGGRGNDQVEGDEGNDTIYGNQGNDLLVGRQGNDTIRGGSGNDDIFGDYDVNTTYGGADRLYGEDGNDYIYGGRGNDTIDGGTGNDILYGGRGNDTIVGGSGDDDIIGQEGQDTLTGGAGADTFWFLAINEGQDTIKDFGNNDKLELSNILTGYDNGDDINDFLFAVQTGGDTIISADNSGSGNINAATAIVRLENDTVSVNDLFNNGNIIV
ncbi:MAG: calcium-binding protein, partial [Pseudomonadota bacterium]